MKPEKAVWINKKQSISCVVLKTWWHPRVVLLAPDVMTAAAPEAHGLTSRSLNLSWRLLFVTPVLRAAIKRRQSVAIKRCTGSALTLRRTVAFRVIDLYYGVESLPEKSSGSYIWHKSDQVHTFMLVGWISEPAVSAQTDPLQQHWWASACFSMKSIWDCIPPNCLLFTFDTKLIFLNTNNILGIRAEMFRWLIWQMCMKKILLSLVSPFLLQQHSCCLPVCMSGAAA